MTELTSRQSPSRWAAVIAVVLGVFFTGLGLMRLLPIETDQYMFEGWGLAMWVRTGTGAAQLLAGALLLSRRWRPVGAVGIFTIMVAAGTVHAALEHNMLISAPLTAVPALLAGGVAWAYRRELAELPSPRHQQTDRVDGASARTSASWGAHPGA